MLAVSLSLTYLNYRGLSVVGHTAMTTTIFIITPFVLLCALAAPHATPSNWLQAGRWMFQRIDTWQQQLQQLQQRSLHNGGMAAAAAAAYTAVGDSNGSLAGAKATCRWPGRH